MLCHDACEYASTNIEHCGQAHESRLRSGNKVVKNLICHRFVERAFVTVRPDVQLQAFEFDALAIGNVIKVQGRKIGLPRFWAQAGEFRYLHTDQEVPFRVRIGKRFQSFVGFARHLSVNSRSAKIPAAEHRGAGDQRRLSFR